MRGRCGTRICKLAGTRSLPPVHLSAFIYNSASKGEAGMTGTPAGILDGKVAIVTGAGRGLGRVMTLGLLDAGARVAAVELDGPALEETRDAAEDRGAGERFIGIAADVTWNDSGPKILRAATE